MMKHFWLKTVAGVTLVMVSAMLMAQTSGNGADPSAPTPGTAPATQPAGSYQPDEEEASADAVIRELLESRGQVPVNPEATSRPASQPESVAPTGLLKPLPMPPGMMVWNREGRLVREKESDWWLFRMESEKLNPTEQPMRILPNRLLEAMEDDLDHSPVESIRFLISGEVTQYRGRQYLLIRKKLVRRELGAF